MRWPALALSLCVSAFAAHAQAQFNQPGVATQTGKIDLALAKRLTTSCTTITLAEADREVKTRVRNEMWKGAALAVIEFASAEEPAARAAAVEFMPILLKKISKPAMLAAFSSSELSSYQRRGYGPQSLFEVCRPKAFLQDAIVIRPVQAPARAGHEFLYMAGIEESSEDHAWRLASCVDAVDQRAYVAA